MRNLGTMSVKHRPLKGSLQESAYDGISYIETPDTREQDDVLLDLVQEWYRERSLPFIDGDIDRL